MAKKRITLTVNEDSYDQLRELTRNIPGFTVSGMVSEFIDGAAPLLSQIVEAAKKGDKEALLQLMHLQLGGLVEKGGFEVSKLRMHLTDKEVSRP